MLTTDATAGGPKATRREWIGLAVIAVPCLLYSMDLNVLNLAIPHLTADLQPSATQLLWIVDIYGFLLAGFAESLKNDVGAGLLAAARAAFTQGMQSAALVSSVLAVVAALVCTRFMKREVVAAS